MPVNIIHSTQGICNYQLKKQMKRKGEIFLSIASQLRKPLVFVLASQPRKPLVFVLASHISNPLRSWLANSI